MQDPKERWGDILQEISARLPGAKEEYINSREYDAGSIFGSFADEYAGYLSLVGCMEYLVNGNIPKFKALLPQATMIYAEDLVRYDQGLSPRAFMSMLYATNIFYSLAAGDFNCALEFAKVLGGRGEEVEKNTEFSYNLGYTIKYIVQKEYDTARPYLEKFQHDCKKPIRLNFKAYPIMFQAIIDRDEQKANEAFLELLKGHKKECKGRGERKFKGSEEEYISTWGLGLANLARHYGLDVRADDYLVPVELLVPVNKKVK